VLGRLHLAAESDEQRAAAIPDPPADNGAGRVVSTELSAQKVITAAQNLADAGLDAVVEIRASAPGRSHGLKELQHRQVKLSASDACAGFSLMERTGRPDRRRRTRYRCGMASADATLRVALVLEVDPDLGRNIDPAEWELARQACRGEMLAVPRGQWQATETGCSGDLVAFVILDGLLARELSLQERCMVELLGGGDVLQPPVVTDRPRLATETRLTAVSDLLLLVLGQPFVRAAARWPTLLTALHRRLEAQRDGLALQGLIAHLPNTEQRLLLMLSHLADRWGYVTPEGIVLPLPLNHEILGLLIGARRPTVSIAVRRLEGEAGLRRREDGSWLLTRTAERMIKAITQPPSVTHSVGERLLLYRQITQPTAQTRALHAEAKQIRSLHPARATPKTRPRPT